MTVLVARLVPSRSAARRRPGSASCSPSSACCIVVLLIAAGLIWYERRLLSLFQDRYGPNRVGPAGLLQVLADTFKILFKEDWVPPFADKRVFVVAPAIVLMTALLSFMVVPVASGIVVADLNIGLLFVLGMSSLAVYSVVLAGWSSHSKYSLVGGLRAAAQMVSYEVFMGLSLVGVVLMAGSFSLVAHRRGPARPLVRGAAVHRLRRVPGRRASPRRGASRSTSPRPTASSWPATTPSTRA